MINPKGSFCIDLTLECVIKPYLSLPNSNPSFVTSVSQVRWPQVWPRLSMSSVGTSWPHLSRLKQTGWVPLPLPASTWWSSCPIRRATWQMTSRTPFIKTRWVFDTGLDLLWSAHTEGWSSNFTGYISTASHLESVEILQVVKRCDCVMWFCHNSVQTSLHWLIQTWVYKIH